MQGLQPNLAALYPPIQFPVSRGTPMIAPLIKWEHSHEWTVPNFSKYRYNSNGAERQVTINIKDSSNYQYITGHVIDGKIRKSEHKSIANFFLLYKVATYFRLQDT